ncbi:scopoletin glucosyltransferase isoform X1 [Beta vulgaris subsp. vulgaris]|uniref:scopoletin glucosyltransferase isoform X1 n=1 Tax=Beta vulgaris subsp. vulgaris TaxID=3555 RepID=UPI0025472869|nr:scopoletin glucosyltransferase isoform X1 [Beta vulgaris subsp. vulgaris]XP_057247970.1 scopoletin glucosyltransferase isoform X1 [Beta vulgaris subsp. vulgaris]XP_057247971.1 scopoletin glucosyltransferase isoform X1 [Beta vulgaris subsp. vulgaris]XP_057247972.1 scopoletin glucosyltransferase isoform X1 [Beta vulgaris subsp. vulgaris]XP_057247973.1 scopoletin glucosyltransferase isoform X1 [Beta vulgaris subsp. vulgaris]XP_057247974.1 scopoletin glucosyltransferase isoform X1 [Beta vulgari
MMTSEQAGRYHIFFLPFMAPGHIIPTLDMARLFATQGIKSTVVTTPANLHYFTETLDVHTQKPGIEIDLLTMIFPYEEAGLPEGCENFDSITSPEMFYKLFKAIDLLQHPFTNLMEKYQPNCLVADPFFYWANSIATKFGVPRLVFNGSSYFSRCIISNLLRFEPHKNVSSDSEAFIVPGDLPHEIKLTKSELAPYHKKEGSDSLLELMDKIKEGVSGCYGVIMNSFYELESAYIDYYEKITGNKSWHIGPCSLYFNEGDNNGVDDHRGEMSSINVSECRRWLDGNEVNSVLYICLGSMSNVLDAQLHEIAVALEALDHQNFILVVRKEDTKDCFPHGFEATVEGRGLIVRGWAPQTMILNHPAVGGFVTHCGWNSILEGVIAGVPMMTWPLHAEQFYNEKLVTDVLNIGIPVGAKRWVTRMGIHNIVIGNIEILNAMKRVMLGKEAEDMRIRGKELKEMARKAVSTGGSSCSRLSAFIGEIKSYKN